MQASMRRMVVGAFALLLYSWAMFWWGHYFGVTTADRTWTALEEGDRFYLQTLIAAKSDVPSLRSGIEAQLTVSSDRTDTFRARYDSLSWFLLYPLMGPAEQVLLYRMRAEHRK